MVAKLKMIKKYFKKTSKIYFLDIFNLLFSNNFEQSDHNIVKKYSKTVFRYFERSNNFRCI